MFKLSFRSIPLRAVALLILLFSSMIAQAQSALPPSSVSALIYSRTAVELFWTPQVGHLVEVTRNGEELGIYDARSLFQPGLETGKQYNYTLRSVDSEGRRSNTVILSLRTSNMMMPITRVLPLVNNQVVANDPVSPPPPVVEPPSEPTPEPVVEPVSTDITNNDTPSTSVVESPTVSEIAQTNSNCIARDISSLLSCVRNANAYSRIDLANDMTCGNNCCPNGGALVELNGVRNLEFAGNGHRLLRSSGQRQCGLLDINGASNIRVSNVRLDDDQRIAGCQVAQNCPRMVNIKNSSNISFHQAHISNGKGYAFYVQSTNGFRFEHSSLNNSGVLGMYIGHGNNSSTNIRITNSTFRDNQTNGLALLGVHGQSLESNLVADNLFIRNHRRGQWAVLPKYGTGFTGGGQFYIAQANNVTVRNNVVKDGYCDNCFIQRKNRSGVSGIELGLPNRASVHSVVVSGNSVVNHDGYGISQNSNSTLRNVQIRNNLLLNTSSGEHVSGAQKSGNQVVNTQRFDSFESGSDLGRTYNANVTCSANGSVTRRCGAGSRFGQCAVQLQLGRADCSDLNTIEAELLGPQVSIRAGQRVVADGWVRAPRGRWCVVFRDTSGNKLSEQCRKMTDVDLSDVQSFIGLPSIDVRAPSGSGSVQLRIKHSKSGHTMTVDDLKLSVSN